MLKSLDAVEQYMFEGEELLASLTSEIDNNYFKDKSNYLEYLMMLKKQFYKYLSEASVNSATDNNLITYSHHLEKYKNKDVKNEWNVINFIFSEFLIAEESRSIDVINDEFENEKNHFRRISMPFITWSDAHWENKIIDIEQIKSNNWTGDFIKYYNGELAVTASNFLKIQKIFSQLLAFSTEKHQAEFICAVLGHILIRIKAEEARESSMLECFETQKDYDNIIKILISNLIIHDATLKWNGVLLNDGRFNKSVGAINALIECLEDKGYLKHNKLTHQMRAFCHTFRCSLSKPTKQTTIHNDFMIVFNEIIPPQI